MFRPFHTDEFKVGVRSRTDYDTFDEYYNISSKPTLKVEFVRLTERTG